MAINLATKFSPVVDETFTEQSKSSLVVNSDYDFVGSKSIKIYSVGTAEMNDYGRNTDGTARYGTPKDLNNDVQEEQMEKDRSFTFVIDKMDEDETLGAMNAGTALARQINEKVIPEVDKYVYQKMADKAGNTIEEDIDNTNAYDSLATANEIQDEALVPEQGRVCVGTPAFVKNLKADERAVLDTDVGQNIRIKGVIGEMDGVSIQKVTSKLLPENVNYILAHPVATTFAVKLADYKIHEDAPGVSGSLVEGRIYYTAFVRNNKKSAILVSKKKSSIDSSKKSIKVSVPSEETSLNLGEKTVQDLCENLSIGDTGKVTGTLKYVENWAEFSKTDNTGNFIPLYFEEAKGQAKGTIKCELKGTGAKLKKPVAVDEKDGLIVFQVHDKDNTIEITSDGKETKTLTLSEVELQGE